MPIKIKTVTLFTLATLVIASVTSVIQLQKEAFPDLSGELVFKGIDGSKRSLNSYKGKPLLITFWSPNCTLCLAEVTHFNKLYNELQGGNNFELLALSMFYDRPDRVIASSKQSDMTYPVFFDLQKKLSKAFGNIVATPTSFLLSRDGQIIYRHVGVLDFPLLKQKLIHLIG